MNILYIMMGIIIFIPIGSFLVIRYVSKTASPRQLRQVSDIHQTVADHRLTLVNIKERIHETN